MIKAIYDYDGWMKYEQWDLPTSKAKQKAKAIMQTGLARYIILEHELGNRIAYYLNKSRSYPEEL